MDEAAITLLFTLFIFVMGAVFGAWLERRAWSRRDGELLRQGWRWLAPHTVEPRGWREVLEQSSRDARQRET